MGSVSLDDGTEERCGGYNISADVWELESSNGDALADEGGGSSRSASFSPFAGGGKNVLVWEDKPLKKSFDLSSKPF